MNAKGATLITDLGLNCGSVIVWSRAVFRLFIALLALAFVGCVGPMTPPRASDLIKIDPSSEWAEFADYMRNFTATVEARWFAILNESRVAPQSGTQVAVTFTIDADGKVTVLKTDGDAGQQGTYACTAALMTGSVGGKWTDAMIAKLGRQQTLTFTFRYY